MSVALSTDFTAARLTALHLGQQRLRSANRDHVRGNADRKAQGDCKYDGAHNEQ
jgi:hypothetical protein